MLWLGLMSELVISVRVRVTYRFSSKSMSRGCVLPRARVTVRVWLG